ncbi:MAG: SU10 major capsid protein [Plesiomonas sp.]
MTMLKTFDLTGNHQSFANWISNLSPTETPFISMIPKQKVDQTQYSWQTDRLSQAGKQAKANAQDSSNTTDADEDLTAIKEGDAATINNMLVTTVHTNFTQIFRKAVRVTDTTKKIALYGRNSELAYQMEKAGKEIKRDLEHALLNSTEKGRPGTAALHGICDGVLNLVAPAGAKDPDTGAVVHKVVKYEAGKAKFTKADVFDLTLNLYLVGARANKIMFHPMHMATFSDWVSDTTGTKNKTKAPHLHRMFEGLNDKYNAYVKKVRDPLGQEFTLIPNRHMPANQLFFFNEADWTQMVLREPEKVLLAKMGSSEKHMIEMEVGLRTRSPFASGILEFNQTKSALMDLRAKPNNKVLNVDANGAGTDTVTNVEVQVLNSDGERGKATDEVTFEVTTYNDDGKAEEATVSAAAAATDGVAKGTVTHKKASRVKVTAKVTAGGEGDGIATVIDLAEPRD